jgi:hypothetical protein
MDAKICSDECFFGFQNQLEDHTCGFLASCAVVASSLLPPFARATSKQEVLSGSELQK